MRRVDRRTFLAAGAWLLVVPHATGAQAPRGVHRIGFVSPTGPGPRNDAFLRGLGLDPAAFPPRDADAEMEEFGRAYRLMLEGLMHLLRKRAREKDSARVSRTIVGAVDVNPLKFMPTADAALATMMHGALASISADTT